MPAVQVGAFPTSRSRAPAATETNLTDITTIASDNNAADLGYFFRVKDGEKFITDNIIFGGVVVTLSYMPDAAGHEPRGLRTGWQHHRVRVDAGKRRRRVSAGDGTDARLGWPPPPPVRSKTLGNGAPTNPRLTISKIADGGPDDGKIVVNGTVQTSSGEVKQPRRCCPGIRPGARRSSGARTSEPNVSLS